MSEYAERDIEQLDTDGNYYIKHISAMTIEQLLGKSEIAAELAYRDHKINTLSEALVFIKDFAVDDDIQQVAATAIEETDNG